MQREEFPEPKLDPFPPAYFMVRIFRRRIPTVLWLHVVFNAALQGQFTLRRPGPSADQMGVAGRIGS